MQQHARLSFAKALAELRLCAGSEPVPQVTKTQEEPFPYELLARVAEVWHQAFCEGPDGLAYLEKRGLKERQLLQRVGLLSGSERKNDWGRASRMSEP